MPWNSHNDDTSRIKGEMVRPYMQCSSAELKILTEKPGATLDVVAAVIAELSHRSTKGARKLRDELCAKYSVATPDETEIKQSAAHGEIGLANQDLDSRESTPEFEARFEALRLTFTVEAEILARWGVTPALPEEIRNAVFADWKKKLTDSPDGLGRSLERLERDIAKLDEEARTDWVIGAGEVGR
jgi:hypothetical protein